MNTLTKHDVRFMLSSLDTIGKLTDIIAKECPHTRGVLHERLSEVRDTLLRVALTDIAIEAPAVEEVG